MRRVPIGIVGDGRVAKHITCYFDLLKIPHKIWSRKTSQGLDLIAFFEECETVLILINDDAINNFIEDNPRLGNKKLVHFSGSLVLENIQSAHPMMSFGKQTYDLPTYKKIPFILEKGKTSFRNLFPDLPNPHFEISSSKKDLYHALCVISGNFTTLLWQKMFQDLQKEFSIPESAVLNYMDGIIYNLKDNWRNALTGPFARNDLKTIERNINALSGDPFQEVYRSFKNVRSYEK